MVKLKSLTNSHLIEKIRNINNIRKTVSSVYENSIRVDKSPEEMIVSIRKLPKMSSEVVLTTEKPCFRILESEANLLSCPNCLTPVLAENGPLEMKYRLKGVVIEQDYSLDFIKRNTVKCLKCDHKIGFEWRGTLYVK